jgi:hypothetical protein
MSIITGLVPVTIDQISGISAQSLRQFLEPPTMLRKLVPATFMTLAAGFLPACSQDTGQPPAATPTLATQASSISPSLPACSAEQGLTYLCGLYNAEDLIHLGDTGLLLASGMSRVDMSGRLYLINPNDLSFQELIHGESFTQDHDRVMFADCPGNLPLEDFSMHGLALRQTTNVLYDIYATSHGAREAVEIFQLDVSGGRARLTWRGCVVMPAPANTFINSVAILDDGGFLTTKMMDPLAGGFAAINAGEITGHVFEWHPGGEVEIVAGTELSGANGIELSADGHYMYVTAMGTREVVRFDRTQNPVSHERISVDIVPDNIRWGAQGRLLTAGGNVVDVSQCNGNACATGWSVIEIDADSMSAQKLGGADQHAAIQGVSTALEVDGNIWVGTYNGDRIAFFARSR